MRNIACSLFISGERKRPTGPGGWHESAVYDIAMRPRDMTAEPHVELFERVGAIQLGIGGSCSGPRDLEAQPACGYAALKSTNRYATSVAAVRDRDLTTENLKDWILQCPRE